MARRLLILLLLLSLVPVSQAAIELYDFSSEEQRARFHELGGILRCPKCQNQSIIDSDSASAGDMREELFQLLQQGYSDEEVLEYLKARFGEYIVYRPPVRDDTLVLWFLPPAMILVGLLVLVFLARSRKKQIAGQDRESLSERQLRLKQILELDKESPASSSKTDSKDDS
ncbi:cytochrome c-type biogenesis protein [Marinospirillum perlucidum]|uniref:cytochrome c-type biogenesis protein n=1 Tax=Marinospirillum perlucidum TaxID=1982602 RepID=UPI000DF248A5|nr:cytochrome c-type biogenesis protein [Marinospirillum perlucidum]